MVNPLLARPPKTLTVLRGSNVSPRPYTTYGVRSTCHRHGAYDALSQRGSVVNTGMTNVQPARKIIRHKKISILFLKLVVSGPNRTQVSIETLYRIVYVHVWSNRSYRSVGTCYAEVFALNVARSQGPGEGEGRALYGMYSQPEARKLLTKRLTCPSQTCVDASGELWRCCRPLFLQLGKYFLVRGAAGCFQGSILSVGEFQQRNRKRP